KEHLATAHSYDNLAYCLHSLEKYAEATDAFRSASLGWGSGRQGAGKSGFDRSHFKVENLSPWQGQAVTLVRQGKVAEAWVQAEAHLARGLLEDLDLHKVAEDSGRLARIEKFNASLLPLLTRSELSREERKQRDTLLKQRRQLQTEMAKALAERAEGRL